MKGYSITRDMSPHAFGMNLPAIGQNEFDILTRRRAVSGSIKLRHALLQYEIKHHPDAQLRVAK